MEFFVLLDTYLARLGFVLHNIESVCSAIGMDTALRWGYILADRSAWS